MSRLPETESSEIRGSHPKEVADEILQNLLDFASILDSMSKKSGESVATLDFFGNFSRLIDGISTMTEGVASVKKLFKIESLTGVDQLETELLGILKELLTAQEQKDDSRMKIILENILPPHFDRWKQEGIPSLIRSRDC